MSSPPSLLILDDPPSLAQRHFSPFHPRHLSVSSQPSPPRSLSALAALLRPHTIISTMRERTPFPAELLASLPNLRLLLTTGTRNASIDLAAAREGGIVVAGTTGRAPDRLERTLQRGDGGAGAGAAPLPPPSDFGSVNQHAWALLLALCSRLDSDARRLRAGAWQGGLVSALGGRTIGLVGLGKLGAQMGRTAVLGFGMRVVAWSENLTRERASAGEREMGLPEGAFEVVGKEELLRRADVVSLHLVLGERTAGVIGERELGLMKDGAVLVNTARAGLVDEEALARALGEGRIGGAGLDVFWEEPLAGDSRWRRTGEWARSEVVLSPHMGYVNAGTMERWYEEQAENVRLWLRGEEVLNRMD